MTYKLVTLLSLLHHTVVLTFLRVPLEGSSQSSLRQSVCSFHEIYLPLVVFMKANKKLYFLNLKRWTVCFEMRSPLGCSI